MPSPLGQITLIVYGVLLIVGGAVGGARAGSKESLYAGVGSGVVALICAAVARFGSAMVGYILGAILSVALLGMMASRYMETKKFMPSGMIALLSLAVLVIRVVAILRSRLPS